MHVWRVWYLTCWGSAFTHGSLSSWVALLSHHRRYAHTSSLACWSDSFPPFLHYLYSLSASHLLHFVPLPAYHSGSFPRRWWISTLSAFLHGWGGIKAFCPFILHIFPCTWRAMHITTYHTYLISIPTYQSTGTLRCSHTLLPQTCLPGLLTPASLSGGGGPTPFLICKHVHAVQPFSSLCSIHFVQFLHLYLPASVLYL